MNFFKDSAVITDLDGNKIQEINCQEISDNITTGGFAGGGKSVNSQTLDLITRTNLESKIKPYEAQCIYDGATYLIVAIRGHGIKPIKRQMVKDTKQKIISLQ